jgi:hypothetical protein
MNAQKFQWMTLANMRANGVRSLAISCGALWATTVACWM